MIDPVVPSLGGGVCPDASTEGAPRCRGTAGLYRSISMFTLGTLTGPGFSRMPVRWGIWLAAP